MSTTGIKYDDICDKCAHEEYCDMATFGGHNPKITACSKFTERNQTNADRIRAMDIDQLSEWYCRGRPCATCPYNGVECGIKDWLEREATNG